MTVTNQDADAAELAARAVRIDDELVLSIAYEPPQAMSETIFGLDDAALRRVVALTLARVGVEEPVELSMLITDDAGLRTLNREYRDKDEPTDVLSFPLLDEPLVEAPAEQLWAPPDEEADEVRSGHADDDEEDGAAGLDESLADAEAAVDGHDEGDDLTFDYDADVEDPFLTPEDEHLHLGDIALSRDAVERQAAQAGHSPARELAFLLAHGVLHLVGFDDMVETGYRAMVAHQEAVLAAAGIAG